MISGISHYAVLPNKNNKGYSVVGKDGSNRIIDIAEDGVSSLSADAICKELNLSLNKMKGSIDYCSRVFPSHIETPKGKVPFAIEDQDDLPTTIRLQPVQQA